MVFNIAKTGADLVIHGQTRCNMHPQYFRPADSEAGHDVLTQENHGNVADARGSILQLTGGEGADIGIISRKYGGNQ